MNKLLIVPLSAALLFGGSTVFAQTSTNQATKPAQEAPVKHDWMTRCLHKNGNDATKCVKTKQMWLERCMKKQNLTKEQCQKIVTDRKAQLRVEHQKTQGTNQKTK